MTSPQEKLRDDLLSGMLQPEAFLKQVLQLDQQSSSHEEAEGNLRILEDPEVVKVFEGRENQSGYYNLLSFTHFHLGQLTAEPNPNLAFNHFEASLSAAKRVDWEDYDWKLYVEGTVAYLERDLETLDTIISQMPEGPNRIILGNLGAGLKARGTTEYMTDYSRE